MSDNLSLSEKLHALYRVVLFRPAFSAGIVFLSLFAAVLEGVGLSFLLPVIELARDKNAAESANGILAQFVDIYEFIGLPFTLEYIIVGVAIVMTARYTSSFLVSWLQASVRQHYVEHLQSEAFGSALDAKIAYFDQQGSDEILNAIVTQASQAGSVIKQLIRLIEETFLSLIYLSVALYLAPMLTIAAGVLLGGVVFVLRFVLESGYSVGDRVASANERVQESTQAGMQGIRDVKLFGLTDELWNDFCTAVNQAVTARIHLSRNQAALDNFYQLSTAVTVFVLIYGALTFSSLSLANLGVFLFAMFRLAPRVSGLNNIVYNIEGSLPHLVRTQEFIDELKDQQEPQTATEAVPETVKKITFRDVSFSYNGSEKIFDGLSLSIDKGEFVAFVGPSGAGKSTIASLLTKMYEPDSGVIEANRTPIDEYDIEEWRSRISIVRQRPFIFNQTLRKNITIGNRDATQEEIDYVCEIAQVTEFLDELPHGYDTVLGDNGVKLSGGQKQRVALARALLKDAEFLVLDEATSDLDSNIEEGVQEAIESMDRDYGMLVIAHRLSTVVNADRIYAVEDGQITESGPHDELIEQRGTYAELYETQIRGN